MGALVKALALGLCVGGAWAITHRALAFPMLFWLAVLVVFPLIEEALRIGALRWAAARAWFGSSALPGLGFGLGFSLAEAGPRWWRAGMDQAAPLQSFIAPLAPFLMHIMLSVLAWRLIGANQTARAFVLCLGLHVAHNWLALLLLEALETNGARLWAGVSISALYAAIIAWQIKAPPAKLLSARPRQV